MSCCLTCDSDKTHFSEQSSPVTPGQVSSIVSTINISYSVEAEFHINICNFLVFKDMSLLCTKIRHGIYTFTEFSLSQKHYSMKYEIIILPWSGKCEVV